MSAEDRGRVRILGTGWLLFLALAACSTQPRLVRFDGGTPPAAARLTSRPGPGALRLGPGLHTLGLAPDRDGLLFKLAIDPRRVALMGFSAGGGMALSLGPSNGDLFSWIIAFGPTQMDVAGRVGRPRFFVAHGTVDEVVPIDRTSRAFVPALRAAGDSVVYREFPGPHVIPTEPLQEAITLLLEG
jgi:pimeloyl-ACP methyl ester carboxylesterase